MFQWEGYSLKFPAPLYHYVRKISRMECLKSPPIHVHCHNIFSCVHISTSYKQTHIERRRLGNEWPFTMLIPFYFHLLYTVIRSRPCLNLLLLRTSFSCFARFFKIQFIYTIMMLRLGLVTFLTFSIHLQGLSAI